MIKIKAFPCGSLCANCYVVGDENGGEAFLVDPGGPNGKAERYIREMGYSVSYILLTHGHGDHIGGVKHFRTLFPGVKILAGAGEEKMLSDPELNYSGMTVGQPVSITADRYLSDGESVKIGTMEVLFLETPGHTMGGISIFMKEPGCVFTGDTLFAGSVGRTDLGGSASKLSRSIRNQLMTLPPDTVVYPGHGEKTTIKTEKESNPFV